MKQQHVASDGSRWDIFATFIGIGATHEDYDGAPDAYDHRHTWAKDKKELIENIEELIAENV